MHSCRFNRSALKCGRCWCAVFSCSPSRHRCRRSAENLLRFLIIVESDYGGGFGAEQRTLTRSVCLRVCVCVCGRERGTRGLNENACVKTTSSHTVIRTHNYKELNEPPSPSPPVPLSHTSTARKHLHYVNPSIF